MAEIRGNDKDNNLKGTSESDSIFGLAGDDILKGLGGGDLKLDGGDGDDEIYGGGGKDLLLGKAGNDVMDGDSGADTMKGAAGDDIYVVNTLKDRTIEKANKGTDTVRASLNWVLSNNIENLELTGSSGINGTGNALDNTITGNSGRNALNGAAGDDLLIGWLGEDTLNGGDGNDILFGGVAIFDPDSDDKTQDTADTDQMAGGAGDDTFYVNSTKDVVTELVDQGTDKVVILADVYNGTSYTLVDNVENLDMLGLSNVDGIGNALANDLQGNSGSNVLDGKAGNDTLTGESGSDLFQFSASGSFTNAAIGVDVVVDFVRGTDLIGLSRSTFNLGATIGTGLGSEFESVDTDSEAAGSSAVIVFSEASRRLFYNPNGTSGGFGNSGASGAFAIISGVSSLSGSNFFVVS